MDNIRSENQLNEHINGGTVHEDGCHDVKHSNPAAIKTTKADDVSGDSRHQYVTISELLRQDVPNGAMLLEFPSTFNKSLRFVNDEKYLIYDFPPPTAFYNEFLLPLRACPVAGSDIPLLISGYPIKALQDHWQKWVPGYTPPVIRPANDVTNPIYDVIVTSFPHQQIPASRHAVNPDTHYRLMSKACIPYMGAPHPRHVTPPSCTFPCMVKAAQGKSTKGTFMANSEQEMMAIVNELENHTEHFDTPVFTEVVENIEGNYCLQFYLFKTGEIHWLGVTRQVIGDQFVWRGGVVHWGEQAELRSLLWDSIRPVKEYLHKEGYFGFVGIDVLTNKQGQFVIDVNARINGTTPQLLLAPRLAQQGYDVSVYLADGTFSSTTEGLLQFANGINCEGEARTVVLSAADVGCDGCVAHVAVFGKTEQDARKVYKKLMSL